MSEKLPEDLQFISHAKEQHPGDNALCKAVDLILSDDQVRPEDRLLFEERLSQEQRDRFVNYRLPKFTDIQTAVVALGKLTPDERSELAQLIRFEFANEAPEFRGFPGHLEVKQVISAWEHIMGKPILELKPVK